jgi:hypothetical protein
MRHLKHLLGRGRSITSLSPYPTEDAWGAMSGPLHFAKVLKGLAFRAREQLGLGWEGWEGMAGTTSTQGHRSTFLQSYCISPGIQKQMSLLPLHPTACTCTMQLDARGTVFSFRVHEGHNGILYAAAVTFQHL